MHFGRGLSSFDPVSSLPPHSYSDPKLTASPDGSAVVCPILSCPSQGHLVQVGQAYRRAVERKNICIMRGR